MADTLAIGATTRRAFERLSDDFARVFGDRLIAVVASGTATGLAFVTDIQSGDLTALGPLTESWHRDGLDTPLVLTPDEFRRSLDAFPLEYQTLLDRHAVIRGRPPFEHVSVNAEHLRRACEVQAKGHLLHLRQGAIDAAGHEHGLAELMARSAQPLRALLANVARLEQGAQSDGDLAIAGARLAGLSEPLVTSVLALEHAPERAHSLVAEFPAYLSAAQTLWTYVDSWRPR